MRIIVLVIFGLSFCIACHDRCQVYQERCTADVAEICSGDKDWQEVADCADFSSGPWVCCEFEYPDAGITAGCISSIAECIAGGGTHD